MDKELVIDIVEHTNPPGIDGKVTEIRITVTHTDYDKMLSFVTDGMDINADTKTKAKALDSLLTAVKDANKYF